MPATRIGIIGLGKMGSNMARLALEKGYEVTGYDLSEIPDDLKRGGLLAADSLQNLVVQLSPPRIVMLSIPAGNAVDKVADELSDYMDKNDIILDTGNSYWGDSIRRAARYADKGIFFLDLGTSGGIEGARKGPCFMIGGPGEAVRQVEPFLKDLAVPGGYVHTGTCGTGHFVKLVHNGIEFGMLQAIAEGIDLLKSHPVELDISAILGCWQNGSVIRSWLIDLMKEALQQDPDMKKPTGYIEDTGEVNWLVGDALNMDVAIPVISQSVMQLISSRDASNVAAKSITMMRHGFGDHPWGKESAIEEERLKGRVGPLYRFNADNETN